VNTLSLTLAATLAAILLTASCSTEQEQENIPITYYSEFDVMSGTAITQVNEEIHGCRRDLEVLQRQHEGWMSSLKRMILEDHKD